MGVFRRKHGDRIFIQRSRRRMPLITTAPDRTGYGAVALVTGLLGVLFAALVYTFGAVEYELGISVVSFIVLVLLDVAALGCAVAAVVTGVLGDRFARRGMAENWVMASIGIGTGLPVGILGLIALPLIFFAL